MISNRYNNKKLSKIFIFILFLDVLFQTDLVYQTNICFKEKENVFKLLRTFEEEKTNPESTRTSEVTEYRQAKLVNKWVTAITFLF